MKTLAKLTLLATTLFTLGTAHADPAADAKATYQDIQKTLGLVPSFFKAFPDEGVAAAWDELKSVQLNPKTALPSKTKELIGLAVAAQIPCRYCVYFHTQVAKLGGASDAEIKDAVAMAAITRHWSTVLNGMQIDLGEFKQDLAKILDYVQHPTAKGAASPVTDAASAYKDIERTLGRVPGFMRKFPEDGIAAAWREMKTVQLNPATALDGKSKELIGLAVAAQVPCQYCIAFHTEAAKLNGATDQEIREAVAMAAITRHWSTVLNGSLIDETQFRKEVDQIVAGAKKAAKKK
ncbi:MAG TPA: carboxymuconolactone decarboxylase family protein [Kofleriaceae bacterium]|nr:carboxymuconolactone decarboxylase family protein [Kofleriaceae bacterium]